MNQKLIIGIIAVVILGGGVTAYAAMRSSNEKAAMEKANSDEMTMHGDSWTPEQMEAMKNGEGEMMGNTDDMKKDNAAMMSSGSYETYNASNVAMASATHHVVLFFRASWCPTCIAVDKDIKANIKNIPSNLTILDVNYDNSADLKKKYGVTYQHTFVQVDAQGNLLKKWSGSPTLSSLVSEVQ